jgi:hypothetical protein
VQLGSEISELNYIIGKTAPSSSLPASLYKDKPASRAAGIVKNNNQGIYLPGLQRTSSTCYEFERTNFHPDSELELLVLSGHSSIQLIFSAVLLTMDRDLLCV